MSAIEHTTPEGYVIRLFPVDGGARTGIQISPPPGRTVTPEQMAEIRRVFEETCGESAEIGPDEPT